MSRKHPVEVYDSAGRHLGTIQRHIRAKLWRASGKAQPVWVGGLQRHVDVVGKGALARLVVRLPAGAALPKELSHG